MIAAMHIVSMRTGKMRTRQRCSERGLDSSTVHHGG